MEIVLFLAETAMRHDGNLFSVRNGGLGRFGAAGLGADIDAVAVVILSASPTESGVHPMHIRIFDLDQREAYRKDYELSTGDVPARSHHVFPIRAQLPFGRYVVEVVVEDKCSDRIPMEVYRA